MLWVPGRIHGTGHGRMDAAYALTDEGGVERVGFEPAPIGYMKLHKAGDERAVLNEGEGVWKGEMNHIRAGEDKQQPDEMRFCF